MTGPLLTDEDDYRRGEMVDRPNRFVVRVDFGEGPERAYLGDPGALRGVLEPGATILCSPADDPDRATDHDAVAARDGDVWVSLRAALANDLFAAALEDDRLPDFADPDLVRREPPLPEHGRTDFLLRGPDGDEAYVEVKSCTHVEDGVCKFPDRQTERGRRHLRSLESLRDDGTEAHVVFVVQRPDVDRLEPFREVDPEFADLLARVAERGVGVHALVTAFDPPVYRLVTADLPVELPEE